MANKARGEASIRLGNKRYTLRPTLTAYCDLEDLVEKDHAVVMAEAARGSARATRALIWSYLQACHADEIATVEDASALIDKIGLEKVTEVLKVLEEANAPDASETSADPPAGRAGGAGSSGPRAVSA